MMRDYFNSLADALMTQLTGGEVLLCSFDGEDSDFVRLNKNKVRQAGHVTQRYLHLDLIRGQRHATCSSVLAGHLEHDLPPLRALLDTLRAQITLLSDDPYLMYATEINNSTHGDAAAGIDSGAALEDIFSAAHGLDLVGLWASGAIYSGFANSLGQRNWHQSTTFNFDWSCYHQTDKAVKNNYAGFEWNAKILKHKIHDARTQLDIIARPAITLAPGHYRAYFAPAALEELLSVMAWGGFGLKAHRSARTPLIKMVKQDRRLHADVSLTEDHARGLAPNFTRGGFVTRAPVTLIVHGKYTDCLVNPRSAKEYGVPLNSGSEAPHALDMQPGTLPHTDVLKKLDTGLYINNLWYCNFSDHDDCRITGMTRFACFWVQDGVITAPINVMRFDDSIYRLLGTQLLALTAEREFLFDTSTYMQRSTRSAQLPGALVDDFTLTL
ncbi:MAG: hypothetical protein HY273_10515 [Gammaproteobacteria bacterium]|nr:hypothetical protein [Gammaproteobacteria bacterium]